jgi:hypothetical protein
MAFDLGRLARIEAVQVEAHRTPVIRVPLDPIENEDPFRPGEAILHSGPHRRSLEVDAAVAGACVRAAGRRRTGDACRHERHREEDCRVPPYSGQPRFARHHMHIVTYSVR